MLRICEAISKRATSISVRGLNSMLMLPLPLVVVDEMEFTPVIEARAPSILEVTSCSMMRAEASGQEKLTEMLVWLLVGVYCTLSSGTVASPMTISTAMMSSTENDESRKVLYILFFSIILCAFWVYISRSRPAG